MSQLTWDDLEKSANAVFHIWMENRWEVHWAKRCWNILAKLGLTTYENELERHATIFRFMALAQIYSDFNAAAWRESCNSISIQDIAYHLGVKPFYAGQLAGPDSDIDFDSDWELSLAARYREEVRDALLKGFGSATALFVALWRTRSDNHFASTTAIVNCVTQEKLEAYAWVVEGCLEI